MNITLFPTAAAAIQPNGTKSYVVATVKRDSANTPYVVGNSTPQLRPYADFGQQTAAPAADLLNLFLQEQEAQSTRRPTAQNPFQAASNAYAKAETTDYGNDLGFIYSRVL